ncbi:MAG: tRNA (guanine(46)-N(7))-methyltransferase TrmB [Acetobacteraceae bacterium]
MGVDAARLRPPPGRLYGRTRSHRPSSRQLLLLGEVLPRCRFRAAAAIDPAVAFAARPRELWLEVGSGSGEHALAAIAAEPGIGLIACEVFENGIASMLSTLVRRGEEAAPRLPGNFRIWDADARELIGLLPEASIRRLFLMFPDPWPKARHAKRRFVHPANVAAVARVLAPGAEWRIATDDAVHQAWVVEVLAGQDFFSATAPAEARPAGWWPTRYEAKARAAGRRILYWRAVRRC